MFVLYNFNVSVFQNDSYTLGIHGFHCRISETMDIKITLNKRRLPLLFNSIPHVVLEHVKAGVNMKAVFWLGIMFLMQISCLRFKQSRISLLISHIYVLGCFVNFLVIFRYICIVFSKD